MLMGEPVCGWALFLIVSYQKKRSAMDATDAQKYYAS